VILLAEVIRTAAPEDACTLACLRAMARRTTAAPRTAPRTQQLATAVPEMTSAATPCCVCYPLLSTCMLSNWHNVHDPMHKCNQCKSSTSRVTDTLRLTQLCVGCTDCGNLPCIAGQGPSGKISLTSRLLVSVTSIMQLSRHAMSSTAVENLALRASPSSFPGVPHSPASVITSPIEENTICSQA